MFDSFLKKLYHWWIQRGTEGSPIYSINLFKINEIHLKRAHNILTATDQKEIFHFPPNR